MKRIWAGAVVFLSVLLVNGCSKCSHDENPPPPTASDEATTPPAGGEGEELPTGEAPMNVPVPGTPGQPGAPAPTEGESAD